MLISTYLRALRLPFLTASVLPFIFGSLLPPGPFRMPSFVLGVLAVAATHLGANLINDYADAMSGRDWHDPTYYGLFGGSKLIQEGRLPAAFFRAWGYALLTVGLAAAIALTFGAGRLRVAGFFVGIAFLAWAYSHPPLRLGYRRLGEAVIFLLFGPAVVVGGAYLQSGVLNPSHALFLSLPCGFLTAGILVANEVPDAAEDAASGKHTLVTWIGPARAFLLYGGLAAAAFGCVLAAVILGWLSSLALVGCAALPLAAAATSILRRRHTDKRALVRSSGLAVAAQALTTLGMIAGALRVAG
ncbi:MAG: 1,4-dihydroxy-2-naphthoate octaprenyltransferase [Lentisphaerae bacterium ADurb.BinA184]|nr:MAG: 1,4-dihydroxy-2-naphthoate octaprenyltransferase [Lentisphaerae bacterium ADurb.BinA184]